MSGTLNNSQNLSENSGTLSNCGTFCSEDDESEVRVYILNITTH